MDGVSANDIQYNEPYSGHSVRAGVFSGRKMGKDRKQAVKLAMDVTTLFLLFSVSALFNNTFQSRFGFYLILLVLLIAVGLIGSAQTRWKGKVDVRRLVRVVWRLAFVAMSFCYVVFTFLD